MGTAEKKTRFTKEEYLSLEFDNIEKSEFHNGEIFAMSGATISHNRIAQNLSRLLGNALLGRDCDVLGSDQLVRIEAADSFVYPDLSVFCGEIEHYDDKGRVLLNPKVIFEILSETTEGFDRGGKFRKYQTIPGLEEYVLVDQWEAQLEVLRPGQGDRWEWAGYSGMEGNLDLESLGLSLPIAEIYHRVEFSNRS